jgi:hypothetical protein
MVAWAMANYLTELVAHLQAAAQRMAQNPPPGRASVYSVWATHLLEDARSLELMAELQPDDPPTE